MDVPYKSMGQEKRDGELCDIFWGEGGAEFDKIELVFKAGTPELVDSVLASYDVITSWDEHAPTDDSLFNEAAFVKEYGPCEE